MLPLRTIRQTNVVLTPKYKDDSEAKNLLGYSARVQLQVRLRDLKKLHSLNTGILAAGATSFSLQAYGTSQLAKYRAEARSIAIKAAREKAEFLAGQLDQKIGRAFSISESENGLSAFESMGLSSRANLVAFSPGEGEATEGQIAVTERITVSFELQ